MYKDKVQVGFGFVIVSSTGKMYAPDLFDLNGHNLPQDWYDLVMTSEEHLIVLNKRIQ